jgi:hypothetical protein
MPTWPPNVSSLDKNLLILLQLLNKADVDLESLRNNVGGRQSKPLSQWNILDPVGLVYLNPDEVLSSRRILDVMSVTQNFFFFQSSIRKECV